ncbi:MAG: MATE family efflux transporter [Paracoccaceae bacterium]|jgi:MATE family multidrug resistance protein
MSAWLQSLRREIGVCLTLGVPLIGSQIAQLMLGVTDTIVLGWYSVEDLAALVLASGFQFTFLIFGAGFAFAVAPLVSAAQDDVQTMRRVTRMSNWLVVLYSIAIYPVMFFSEQVFLVLGQDPEISARAQEYLRITGAAMGVMLIFYVLRSYLSARERVREILILSLVGVVLNAIFDVVFVFGLGPIPAMGVQGAAITTAVISILGMGLLAIIAAKIFPEDQLFVRMWRPDFEIMRKLVRLGVPIGFTALFEVGLFSAASIFVGWFGVQALAAHGIVMQLASIAFMLHLGLSQAVTIRIGKAYGRQDREMIALSTWAAVVLSICFAILTVAVFVTVPEALCRIFLDQTDPAAGAILTMSVSLLMIAAAFQFADGLQAILLGVLRGAQDTFWPMVCAFSSYWGMGLGVAYYLGAVLDWQAQGVWIGLTVGLAAAAVTLGVRFIYVVRSMKPAA